MDTLSTNPPNLKITQIAIVWTVVQSVFKKCAGKYIFLYLCTNLWLKILKILCLKKLLIFDISKVNTEPASKQLTSHIFNKKSRDFMQSCFPFFVYFKYCSDFLLYFYKCSISMAFT